MIFKLFLALSLVITSSAWAKPGKIPAQEAKKIEASLQAAKDLGQWVQKPTPKKFRQVYEMVKPFIDPDAYSILVKKGQKEMGKSFPKFKYSAGKEKSEITFFDGTKSQSVFIIHNDPVNVFEINGKLISFEEMLTTIRWVETMEEALSQKPTQQSFLFQLLLPEAHAFFGSLSGLLGPLLIAGGIAGAGYFVGKGIGNIGSKVPTNYTINHNVPTNFAVNLPTTYNVNATGNVNGNITGLPENINIPIGLSAASAAFPAIPASFFPRSQGMQPAGTKSSGTR